MPHGWAVAEIWLLLRDCLVFEHSDRLRLLAGVAPGWFIHQEGMALENLPTHFGRCSLVYKPTDGGATLTLSGEASPPGGFDLALPSSLKVKLTVDGRPIARRENGSWLLPPDTRQVQLRWLSR